MSNLLRVYPPLPNEILIDIFLRHNALPSRRHDSLPQRAYPCNGFNLMLVCHHWRALAISTPSLWQAVKVRGTVDWLSLVLSRSKSLPLDVVIHRSASTSSISKWTRFLSLQFHRVRSIHFPVMTVQIDLLNAIFRRPIPPLTDLDLLVKSGGPLNLAPNLLPALRSLRISSCAVPWNPTMLSRLYCLDLDECTCQGGTVTLGDLLDVLVSAINLRDLRLRNFLSALRQPTASQTGPPMLIPLPNLRKLEIYDLPHLVSRLLSFVRLEPHTDVLITGLILEAVPDTKDAFPSLLPHDRSGLPLLQMVTAGRIKNSHSRICRIEGQMEQESRGGGGPQITLSLDWRFCSEGPFARRATSYLERTLREFAAVFSRAPLESLEINGRYDHARHLDAWVGMYTAFLTIQHLKLEGSRVPSAAVAALGHAPYDDSAFGLDADAAPVAEADGMDSDIDDAGEGAALVLPSLRSLNLKSVDWCPGFTETLLAVIQRRATNGLPKLGKLELGWRNTSDEKGLRRTMKTYSSTLASLVEEVEASFTARRLVQDDTSEDSDSNRTNSGTDTEDEE